MPMPDVVVAGAGVIGCAVARSLAGQGLDVTVVDPGEPGRGASWAAAGMLSPLGEADQSGASAGATSFVRLWVERRNRTGPAPLSLVNFERLN